MTSLHATSLLGWIHWWSVDWGTNGAGRGGSEPLLSAGTRKRDDPEGAAERRETEEARGEEDTVRTSVTPLELISLWLFLMSPDVLLFLSNRRLKNELLEIKRKGSHRPQEVGERQCTRCLKTLGLIFDRGDLCKECQLRVCKDCRVTPPKTYQWKCNVCAKIS